MKIPKMFLNRIFKKTGPPIHLIWFITAKCNLRCAHCFYHSKLSDNADEMSLEEISKTVANLPPLLSVALTGGEPFLRKDLPAIVKLFCSRNLSENIVLFSNGYDTNNILATTEKMLRNCGNAKIFIGVSIDGYESKHDQFRNKKGSYRRAAGTIVGLKKLQDKYSHFNVGVGITLHKGNEDSMRSLRRYVYSQFGIVPGVTLIRDSPRIAELSGIDAKIYKKIIDESTRDRNAFCQDSLFQIIFNTKEEIGQKLAYETLISRSRAYECYAGTLMGIIYENGDVYPCEMLKDSKLGNLRDYKYDINKIWENDRTEEVRKMIKDKKCFCTYECQYTCNALYNIKFFTYFMRNVLQYLVNLLSAGRSRSG